MGFWKTTKKRNEMIDMYLVIAYRYGVITDYQFPIGIFSNKNNAIVAARNHRAFRGGKYDHKVFRLDVGTVYDAEEAKGTWVTGNKVNKER